MLSCTHFYDQQLHIFEFTKYSLLVRCFLLNPTWRMSFSRRQDILKLFILLISVPTMAADWVSRWYLNFPLARDIISKWYSIIQRYYTQTLVTKVPHIITTIIPSGGTESMISEFWSWLGHCIVMNPFISLCIMRGFENQVWKWYICFCRALTKQIWYSGTKYGKI